ncbi:enoyl-CoA hydratase/isomerase family protein [Rhodohalobacter barkolensis]|uniref:Enoyl-CoA hydratase/isomerase family protein n=1 Tax=Rhodohalobacter barkolensis TaxID=2053187 RepID=A0A2N0VHI6_9BACT|nr:enoyl-CoA hydratase/isomerase family protein [Rhodohalobacter barkolensis]PKD43655.1 enoyl-CoA hydratase/isomerase family protein [Rhodohalobacter barkolensis]
MPVSFKKDSYVAKATIDRPDAMNAINFDVMERLEVILTDLEQDPNVRLFVLTGSDDRFISGGDLKEFHSITDAEGARDMSIRMLNILERIENLKCWTLAAVNGHTYGGGWETILSCDFRVAKASAKFGFTQGKFYLPPGWGGLTRLSEVIGENLADYWLASHKVVNSKTALQAGLIQDLFADSEYELELEKLIQRLTLNDRTYIEYMKKRGKRKITDELEPFTRFWESEEHASRVSSFLNRNR